MSLVRQLLSDLAQTGLYSNFRLIKDFPKGFPQGSAGGTTPERD